MGISKRLVLNAAKREAKKAIPTPAPIRKSLSEEFIIPPFTVLDTQKGYWKRKKAAWHALGITSGEGRRDGLSVFDPVLCEIVYRWFCPTNGHVLDPFAGGSVRGIVAAYLGHHYIGIDLSEKQIAANKQQAERIDFNGHCPSWIIGDSRNVKDLAPDSYDLIFSCPPYADLEVYSGDPRDLSTMDYSEFLKVYREIIAASLLMLKPNRFACFVISNPRIRCGDGSTFYRPLVSDTIIAFHEANAFLYNEAVLIRSPGLTAIRAGRTFNSYRKLSKTHEHILVFYKGDPFAIKEEFGQFSGCLSMQQTLAMPGSILQPRPISVLS